MEREPKKNRQAAVEDAAELSTLVTIARFHDQGKIIQQLKMAGRDVQEGLQSPWARRLAGALLDPEQERRLKPQQRKDLESVRALAGRSGRSLAKAG